MMMKTIENFSYYRLLLRKFQAKCHINYMFTFLKSLIYFSLTLFFNPYPATAKSDKPLPPV